MQDAARTYRYIHPEDIVSTFKRKESAGQQLVFTCPLCHQTASFSTIERVDRCFSCYGILKLHTTYDHLPVEELFPTLQLMGTKANAAHLQADRVEIVTRHLSQ